MDQADVELRETILKVWPYTAKEKIDLLVPGTHGKYLLVPGTHGKYLLVPGTHGKYLLVPSTHGKYE